MSRLPCAIFLTKSIAHRLSVTTMILMKIDQFSESSIRLLDNAQKTVYAFAISRPLASWSVCSVTIFDSTLLYVLYGHPLLPGFASLGLA